MEYQVNDGKKSAKFPMENPHKYLDSAGGNKNSNKRAGNKSR